MSDDNFEINSEVNKQPQNEGKEFVMKGEPYHSYSEPKAAVEMRTGANNEEELKKIVEERERIAQMPPGERKTMELEILERELRGMAVELFNFNIQNKGEYSESLIINPDGSLNKNNRLMDNVPPYIVNLFDLKQPQNLYEAMQKIGEENPDLQIRFENDPNGQWLKYKVAKAAQPSK